jgi:hypothetical protein
VHEKQLPRDAQFQRSHFPWAIFFSSIIPSELK